MKKLFLTLALGLFSLSSFAGNQLLKNGQPVEQENVKTGQQITAMTFIISNYKDFKQEWDTTAFDHQPHAKLAEKAKVGDTVHLVTFFSNCLPDEDAKCNMSFKVRIFKDDILIFDSPKTDYKLAYPGENSLQMSNMVLGSNFDNKEVGKYRYEVNIVDENSDDTLTLKTYLTVTEK